MGTLFFPHYTPFLLFILVLSLLSIHFLKSVSSGPPSLFFFLNLFIYLFIFGCVGSPPPCEGFPQPRQAGATLHRGARASHYHGPSRCGAQAPDAQAPDAQAQQPWLTGPVAAQHVGSSQTRARTRVPRIGRQTANHCATREAPTTLSLDSHSQFSFNPIYFHLFCCLL